ncbi:MAG: RHS repeat-associated core domain-containing protein [Bacteroidales bacterium]|nr:RHS repeat-associated core domain-containing protein [Bacteroidales bacterium]
MTNIEKHIIKGVDVGNVTQVTSANPWLPSLSFSETFTYDASDQLTAATEMQNQSYSLSVTYGNWGKITSYSFAQTDLQNNTTQSETQAYTYPAANSIGGSQSLFAPASRSIQKPGQPHSVQTFTFGINGSLRKREVQAQASNTEYYLFNSAANMKAYSNNGLDFAYYGYNAANTRSYKLSMLNQNQWVNGQPEPLHLQLQSAMFYPNAYINFNQNGEYTKHYYSGTERIASRLGDAQPESFVISSNDRLGYRIMQADQQARADLLELVEAGDVPIETPSVEITSLHPTNATSNIFYYHTNHLGSTAYIADINATITQGFLYAPFGEITTEYAPLWQNATLPKYVFNAKELDEETGMYYYEARYYKPPVFTSRDPMFEKYFWMTPYAYCANNPVKYVDPSGEDWYINGEASSDMVNQLNNHTSDNFTLHRNKDGSITYQGEATTKLDKYFKSIVDNPDITVYMIASYTDEIEDGYYYEKIDDIYYAGGAYGGTYIDENGHVDACQYVNPSNGKYWDEKTGKKTGYCMVHEVSESYEAGLITKKKGKEDPFGGDLYYKKAHKKAAKWAMGTIIPIINITTDVWVLKKIPKPSVLPYGYNFCPYMFEKTDKVEKTYEIGK